MFAAIRVLTRALEVLLALPLHAVRLLAAAIVFRPRLGPLRYVILAAAGYLAFAVLLVYVIAPLRGLYGSYVLADKLRYDAERWMATSVYDRRGAFIGTFDPRLDSLRDVNYTDQPIALGDYVANPDHKSIPVREVPDGYWRCLAYHEDRYIGTALNPFGIDLLGVLKIPYSTVRRSLALKRPSLGVGGSTLPMQIARVIYKTPPHPSEGAFVKLGRKVQEWWLAPVIYRELTRGGDDRRLKEWAANHIWLAQRTGGAPLHGIELTSRVVFGKEATELTVAEQFVLASAVNRPILLLPGDERLNEVRLDRWRYIVEVRARTCAERIITDEAEQKKVLFELVQMAGGPPDPRLRPRLQQALEEHAPRFAQRAQANPTIRANALLPGTRFGLREEMKDAFGFGWRDAVRSVTTTIDVVENLSFVGKVRGELATLDRDLKGKLDPGFTLDPDKAGGDVALPNVVVVAANHKGEVVRYFETHETAPYFGAQAARDAATGHYNADRESRMIASTGKMLLAIGVANERRDTPETLYLDTDAPATGLESCQRGGGQRRGRTSLVAFACSLNNPLLHRAALLGQARMRRLVDRFGFAMPPPGEGGQGTPASTAVVLGQIAGSPRRVHHMAGVILAALTDRGGKPVPPPSLVRAYDFTGPDQAAAYARDTAADIVPNSVIRRDSHAMLKTLLQAPLCYAPGGKPAGTLKELSGWCADRRSDLRLHFAKTGTQVTIDANATVDVWVAGGLQFANGAAYSYVVLIGTGSRPWARSVHAGQAGARLLRVLLEDLQGHAKRNPVLAAGPVRDAAGQAVAR